MTGLATNRETVGGYKDVWPGSKDGETQTEGHGRDRELCAEMTGKLEGPVGIGEARDKCDEGNDHRQPGEEQEQRVPERRGVHRQSEIRSEHPSAVIRKQLGTS